MSTPIRPPIRVLCYAKPFSGKSHFAASFPKPMLVLSFDPLDKCEPYIERGNCDYQLHTGEHGQSVVFVQSKKDPSKNIIQIELYEDDLVDAKGQVDPVAFSRYLARLPSLYEEVRAGDWATVVLDSVTGMQQASMNLHQYKLNPTTKEPRQWHASCAHDLKGALLSRLTTLKCNLVVLAHVDTDKDEVAGVQVHQVAAPGKLASADQLPSRYAEMYTIRVSRDAKDKTKEVRVLQTMADTRYNAGSVKLKAPDGCEPTYQALWENFDRKKEVTVS